MRRYRGFMADSSRWWDFAFRDDDIVISTPSKCGTTWMQTIVGMLVLGRTDLGAPISELSPWLDMQIRTTAEVHDLLAAQRHRRWIKTHTPLDGVPEHPGVTYVVVIRHPLDVALSDLDHRENTDRDRSISLRFAAVGDGDLDDIDRRDPGPEDRAEYLRWWIDCDHAPDGSGPHSLLDFCAQAAIAWERRHRPGVVLVHYDDLWTDLGAEMRRIAGALGIDVPAGRWPELTDAARLDAMRDRADATAPEAPRGIWRDARDFFRQGGRRDWGSLLGADDLAHFESRLDALAGPAATWIRRGRAALEPSLR